MHCLLHASYVYNWKYCVLAALHGAVHELWWFGHRPMLVWHLLWWRVNAICGPGLDSWHRFPSSVLCALQHSTGTIGHCGACTGLLMRACSWMERKYRRRARKNGGWMSMNNWKKFLLNFKYKKYYWKPTLLLFFFCLINCFRIINSTTPLPFQPQSNPSQKQTTILSHKQDKKINFLLIALNFTSHVERIVVSYLSY